MILATWDGYCEGGSPIRFAAYVDRTAMQYCQPPHQCKTDTAAFKGPAASSFNPMKALENMRQFVGRNSCSRVLDAQLDRLRSLLERHFDLAVESELQRVRKKIEDDLFPHLSVDI